MKYMKSVEDNYNHDIQAYIVQLQMSKLKEVFNHQKKPDYETRFT